MTAVSKYKVKHLLGTVGDQATEWMSKEETEQFWISHNKYVDELKAKGDYLKEVEYDVSIVDNPLFDKPVKVSETPIESYRMTFLDFSK